MIAADTRAQPALAYYINAEKLQKNEKETTSTLILEERSATPEEANGVIFNAKNDVTSEQIIHLVCFQLRGGFSNNVSALETQQPPSTPYDRPPYLVIFMFLNGNYATRSHNQASVISLNMYQRFSKIMWACSFYYDKYVRINYVFMSKYIYHVSLYFLLVRINLATVLARARFQTLLPLRAGCHVLAREHHATGSRSPPYTLGYICCLNFTNFCDVLLRGSPRWPPRARSCVCLCTLRCCSLPSIICSARGGRGVSLARSAPGVWRLMAACHDRLHPDKPP